MRRVWLALPVFCLQASCAVSTYTLQSESRFTEVPDLSEACSHQWRDGGALYRHYHGWEMAGLDGAWAYSSWPQFVDGLQSRCAGARNPVASEASIRGYFAQIYDLPREPADRATMAVPVMILNAASFGNAPITRTTHYAACLETSSGAQSRSAVAKGILERTVNAWGRSRDEERKHILKLTNDLTTQAWHKLWVAGGTLPTGTHCRTALDAMYSGAARPDPANGGKP